MPLPSSDARIFPGDILGVIGTDDQIKRLNDDISEADKNFASLQVTQPEVELSSLQLSPSSAIIGRPLRETDIRGDFYSMLLKVQRDDDYFTPTPDTILQPGDIIWVVGDPRQFKRMK